MFFAQPLPHSCSLFPPLPTSRSHINHSHSLSNPAKRLLPSNSPHKPIFNNHNKISSRAGFLKDLEVAWVSTEYGADFCVHSLGSSVSGFKMVKGGMGGLFYNDGIDMISHTISALSIEKVDSE
jgi:hypothetical protein